MKYFVIILSVAVLLAGCKKDNGGQPVSTPAEEPSTEVVQTVEATAQATPVQPEVRREDFPFDELFSIFSLFGDNIMTRKFAPQSVKDQLRPDMQESYNGYREFNGNACNVLYYTYFNDGCTDGMHMGCWKYDADGHVLVLIAEEGGCDVCSTKYIRAYEYDPATKNAHEVDIPLEPAPQYRDFNDIIRLAGCNDVAYTRKAMRERRCNYVFSPEGVTVQLNTTDEYEVAGQCGFDLFYRWNGSAFVRDETVPFQCIHGDGFALIKLGGPMPDMNIGDDPMNYDIRYSEGGDLWLVDRGDQRVLEVQMENGKVYSIEVFDPSYSLQDSFYWDGRGRLAVGSRICDYFDFTKDGAPEVRLFSDGTVSIETQQYDTKISFRTTKDDLAGNVPSVSPNDVVMTLSDPQFKPAATIKSIILSKENNQ
jgi:hypothetical protein